MSDNNKNWNIHFPSPWDLTLTRMESQFMNNTPQFGKVKEEFFWKFQTRKIDFNVPKKLGMHWNYCVYGNGDIGNASWSHGYNCGKHKQAFKAIIPAKMSDYWNMDATKTCNGTFEQEINYLVQRMVSLFKYNNDTVQVNVLGSILNKVSESIELNWPAWRTQKEREITKYVIGIAYVCWKHSIIWNDIPCFINHMVGIFCLKKVICNKCFTCESKASVIYTELVCISLPFIRINSSTFIRIN